MKLKLIQGTEDIERILHRVDPLDLGMLPESVLARTRKVFGEGVTPEQSVVRMLRDVREEGDAAVRRYTLALDGVDLATTRVDPAQIAAASAPALQASS